MPHNLGSMDAPCSECDALHFEDERVGNLSSFDDCCGHGKFFVPEETKPFPEELKELFLGEHRLSKDFHARIRNYSSALAFASICTQQDVPFDGGIYQHRIRGNVQTCISTSMHPSSSSTFESERRRRYGQLYVVESNVANEARLKEAPNRGLNAELLAILDKIIRECSVFAEAYYTAAEIEQEELQKADNSGLGRQAVPDVRLVFGLRPGQERRQYNRSLVNEVYAVFVTTPEGEVPEAYITVRNKGGGIRRLETIDENVEAMCFPLFHPYGTRCWRPELLHQNPRVTSARKPRVEFSRREHIAYRLFSRPDKFNPLLHGGKLFQEYLVVQQVHVESDKLRYHRENQERLKRHLYKSAKDLLAEVALERGAFMGDVVILPSTFPGSPRYMREKYNESMSLVKHYGVPSLFITFTCNPKWKEITEACTHNYVDSGGRRRTLVQNANDRPDIIVRAFKLKVDWFFEQVKNGYFGEVLCWDYVIEFQMRGLPHCHCLITLSDRDKPSSAAKVEALVSAEIPDPAVDPVLFELVKAHMVHGPCSKELCLDDSGNCKKKFPKEFRDLTEVDVDSYAKYKRPDNGQTICYPGGYEADNGFVVPYNKRMLVELDCHCNVEVCGSIKAIKYLKKYMFKGCERATVEVTSTNVANYDEIKTYEDGRSMCATGAAWRLFKYPMQKRSHAVVTLHVHLPGQKVLEQRPVADGTVDGNGVPEEYELPEGHDLYAKSHLIAYIELNKRAMEFQQKNGYFPSPNPLQLFYDEVPKSFTWQAKSGTWTVRKSYFNTVGRLPIIGPTQRETFFLRILLLRVKGATCFRDLKTYQGREYQTFGEACLARGLTTDDKEWEMCLREASLSQMPVQLRRLFASILVHCDVVEPHLLWGKFKDVLSEDLRRTTRSDIEGVRQAYAAVAKMLQQQGKRLSDFPTMPPLETVLSEETIDVVAESLKGAVRIAKANVQQKRVIDLVLQMLQLENGNIGPSRPTENCLFLGGEGGTGKTFVYEAIFYAVRGMGELCVTMASTGCAATLLPRGRTVHNVFDIPVPTYSDSESRINVERPSEELLKAKVYIIDEAPMLCKYVLEAVDRVLRLIHGRPNVPFGGVVMLLGGDFAQCLPVSRGLQAPQLVALSVRRSYLWQYFQNNVHILTENMRARQDPRFVQWLRNVGKGASFVGNFGEEAVGGLLSSGNLVDDVYRKLIRGRMAHGQLMNYLSERCILSPKNDICFKYNDEINEMVPGNFRYYRSFDAVAEDAGCQALDVAEEVLHKVNVSSLPPHELALKLNSVVIMMRNLNVSNGLVNGQRFLVTKMHENCLQLMFINGPRKGQKEFIHRIKLFSDEEDWPVKFSRHQFPIRLAYSLSINKAQGQTLKFVGLDLTDECFGHGQFYTGVSRATTSQNVKIMLPPTKDTETARNIVQKEIFCDA